MESENHDAHMQLWGSQGEVHHSIEAKRNDIHRVVLSSRLLQPFQVTVEVQDRRVIGNSRNLWSKSGHTEKGIIDILMGNTRFPMPSDNPLGDGVWKKNHSSQQMVGDGRKLEVESGIHKDGLFREEGKMVRQCVIGMLPSVSK